MLKIWNIRSSPLLQLNLLRTVHQRLTGISRIWTKQWTTQMAKSTYLINVSFVLIEHKLYYFKNWKYFSWILFGVEWRNGGSNRDPIWWFKSWSNLMIVSLVWIHQCPVNIRQTHCKCASYLLVCVLMQYTLLFTLMEETQSIFNKRNAK